MNAPTTRFRMATFAVALSAALAVLHDASAQATGAASAKPSRPRVALVLSGGGARGAAHVGVLKVLDELRIPVDCVVGTSMGSVVGGAFATGSTVPEMESLVSSVGLRDVLVDEPPRREKPIRRKEDDRTNYMGPEIGVRDGQLWLQPGIVSGVGLEAVLRRAVKVKGFVDFDRLPVPFRAVATDIENGHMVVIRDGEVAHAMRASLAIPGVIAPAQLDGRMLVDGMVVRNLPVDVGRELCGDVVIAVDVGTPLMKRNELTSLLAVSQQMLSILTNQNVEESLAELTPSDILIRVALEGFTVADFDRMREIAAAGEQSARGYVAELARLSLPEREYAALRARQVVPPPRDTRPIDQIRVTGLTRVNPEVVLGAMDTRPGEPPDPAMLDRDMQRIYGSGDFQHVDYRLIEEKGKRVLAVEALEKSWGPNFLRFGLTLSSDFTTNSYFNLLGSYRATWLNSLGGEFRGDAQVGRTNRLAAEFYQPVFANRYLFVAPRFEIQRSPIDLFVGDQRVARYDVRYGRAGLDVGTQLTRYGELRAGILAGTLNAELDTGPRLIAPRENVRQGAYTARLMFDQLDSLTFPRNGFGATANVFSSQSHLGADDQYTKWDADAVGAYSIGNHTLQLGAKAGGAVGSELPYYDQFSLGGFLQLSGLKSFQLYGGSVQFGRAAYLYRLSEGAIFQGSYLGLSLEAGRVTKPLVSSNDSGWQQGGALFVAADTPLGPVYLGYGIASGGNRSAYFLLGRP
ncbi:MAG: patatin-like phospholipase family protein [Burkholderiales bacterium]|nr:patatin-like phospholipase family protein [Burkholderiales bacterium]